MDIAVAPGRYVVAVSGGVDSMALLHSLQSRPGLKLTVAHFDHGIRPDSKNDRFLVQTAARGMGLPFVYHEGRLGAGTSEDTARRARYEFLQAVRAASGASHILTAHHRDDVLETVILNLMRGTGRKGLSPMSGRSNVMRPLLHLTKDQLIQYAKLQGLKWQEDPTNADTRYLRNYIRHIVLPSLDENARQQLLDYSTKTSLLNQQIDEQLIHYLHLQPGLKVLERHSFIMLPHTVAREVMTYWLRNLGVQGLDRRTIERLVNAAKTYSAGKYADLDRRHSLKITGDSLLFELRAPDSILTTRSV